MYSTEVRVDVTLATRVRFSDPGEVTSFTRISVKIISSNAGPSTPRYVRLQCGKTSLNVSIGNSEHGSLGRVPGS